MAGGVFLLWISRFRHSDGVDDGMEEHVQGRMSAWRVGRSVRWVGRFRLLADVAPDGLQWLSASAGLRRECHVTVEPHGKEQSAMVVGSGCGGERRLAVMRRAYPMLGESL